MRQSNKIFHYSAFTVKKLEVTQIFYIKWSNELFVLLYHKQKELKLEKLQKNIYKFQDYNEITISTYSCTSDYFINREIQTCLGLNSASNTIQVTAYRSFKVELYCKY